MRLEEPFAQKVVIYGDSISTKNHGEGGYEDILKARLNIPKLLNYASSGSTLSPVVENSGMAIIEANLPPHDTDLIILWYGTNDWYWGARPGSVYDEETDTFSGSMYQTVKMLRKAAPAAKLVWLMPLYRRNAVRDSEIIVEGYRGRNAAGATLLDFYNAIKAGCALHGIPVIDMHALCGFHRENAAIYMEDEIHPNKRGYRIIIDVLSKSLPEVCMF